MPFTVQNLFEELQVSPLATNNLFKPDERGIYSADAIRQLITVVNSFTRLMDVEFLMSEESQVFDVTQSTTMEITDSRFAQLIRIESDLGQLDIKSIRSGRSIAVKQTAFNRLELLNPRSEPVTEVTVFYRVFSATVPLVVPQSYVIDLPNVFRSALAHYVVFQLSSPGSLRPESTVSEQAYVAYVSEVEKLKAMGIGIPLDIGESLPCDPGWVN